MTIKRVSKYYTPTSPKIKKLADAILSASTFAGSIVVLNGYPVIGTVIFCLGYVAKIVSNFFGPDVPDNTETS